MDESEETPEQLLSMITFEGSEQLQTRLKALVFEFIDVFATKVRKEPAAVEPMKIVIDKDKWQLPCNRAPPRRHSEEKQKEIRTQVDALLKLGVIKESQATEWSQVHLVTKPTPAGEPQKWRFTLDFVRLNSATGGLEGWPIPNIQQIINRVGTLKPKVFGIIDFTAGYHQTPLHPDSQEYTAFITQYGLFEWKRVAMGLKGSGPFFQRSMSSKVLAGYVTRICEIYIDDVLVHGSTDDEYCKNLRKVLVRLRENKVTANPRKTRLGLKEVEYVGHLISSTGTSFTPEKRLQVLDFPLPSTEKALLQFIGLVNYFRDHVPQMTEMVQPLRKLIDIKKYKGSKKLNWTDESIAAFHFCRQAVSNCQELYFLEDTATPILQTDASDYGIGGYLYMITNHQLRVVRFFSKALVGSQLNWSAREKECYGIYYGVKLFEDLLDNRYFILKTDHMNLTYINVTFTGKVLRWKLYLQDKDFDLCHVPGKEEHQFVPDALSRLCVNNVPPPPTVASRMIVALRPVMQLPPDIRDRLTRIHNSKVGHWGLDICKRRIREQHRRQGGRDITDRMISEFIRQCPACQVMNRMKVQIKAHRFTCASYNPFEVLHLDHIGPLTKDAHGNEYILVIIDAFSRWVELFPTKSTTALETASILLNHIGRFGSPEVIHTDQGPAFHNELVQELLRLCGIEQSFATAYSSEENGIVERANQEVLRHLRALLFDSRVHDKWSFEQLPLVQRIMNTVEKTSTGVTPAELVLSHSIRLSSHIMAPINSSIDSSDTSLSSRMDEWISRQHTVLIAAQEHQLQSDQHKVVENDPDITDYPVNSYVLYTPPMGRSNKLLPRHKGPYQVIGRKQSIYIIEDLIRGKQIKTHVHNLRAFLYNPTQINPLDIAQQNEQEFIVEEIIAHRGDHHRRSTMEFLVRWTGYDESSNSWEPYKALMHVDKLHDYLREHRMRSLIPREHK